MKILIINYEFPPLGGGGGRASAQIAKELSRKGHKIIVLTSYFKGLSKREILNGYEINRISVLRRRIDCCSIFEMITFLFGGVKSALKIAFAYSPDIVLAFFSIPSAPLAYLIKKLFNIPYVISLRGGDVPGFSPEQLKLYHFIASPFIFLLWSNASAIIANSKGLKELALKFFKRGNIEVIPNGIDLDTFKPSKENLRKDYFQLLYVGRFNHQKGLIYLIEAFSFLPNNIRLELIGDGPTRKDIEDLARKYKVFERINFTGWLSQEKLIYKYQQADLFVLPSLDEGMPNCILEAMATGLPIVATDVSGSRELIQQGINGFLIPPKDSNALASSIQKIMNDQSLKNKMKEKSKELVSKYSWEKVAEEYLRVCEKILKKD